MLRIIKFVMQDIVKNKIVLFYTLLLALLSWGIFGLEDNNSKGILTLLNVILLNVPLVSIIFSTIYIYNSNEFIELLLSQPIHRSKIWISFYLGLLLALVLSFIIGAGIPILIFVPSVLGSMMVIIGILITAVFISLSFLSVVLTRDKAKGIGISIMLWLFFALLFDGLVLFLLFQFSDYPIEKIMVIVAALSPIDLARILVLLYMDASAMMGYTGAIFKQYFGSNLGLLITFFLLFLWALIPFLISKRIFNKMDL